MKRKLLILDVMLVVVVVAAGVEFRKSWVSAKVRAEATRRHTVPPVALPPLPALPAPKPVAPSDYIDVAQKLLFDPSRNPDLPVEPKPVPPPPPPPPPMPALPVYHGMMNFGPGPFVILSVGSNGPHLAVHAGEPIGQFTLVSVNKDGLTFDWNGQKVVKTPDELMDHSHSTAVQAEAAVERTVVPTSTPAAPPQPELKGPGQDTAFGWKTCNMNDGFDPGTVKDGYRKTITATPFGKNCTWDPVK
jgi:hypothetical protein